MLTFIIRSVVKHSFKEFKLLRRVAEACAKVRVAFYNVRCAVRYDLAQRRAGK